MLVFAVILVLGVTMCALLLRAMYQDLYGGDPPVPKPPPVWYTERAAIVQRAAEWRVLAATLDDPLAREVLLPVALTRPDWPLCLERDWGGWTPTGPRHPQFVFSGCTFFRPR